MAQRLAAPSDHDGARMHPRQRFSLLDVDFLLTDDSGLNQIKIAVLDPCLKPLWRQGTVTKIFILVTLLPYLSLVMYSLEVEVQTFVQPAFVLYYSSPILREKIIF